MVTKRLILKERPVEVKQPELGNPIPLTVLAEHIAKLSVFGKHIKESRLKRRVIVLLLHDMTGVNMGSIQSILDALPLLEKEFLK